MTNPISLPKFAYVVITENPIWQLNVDTFSKQNFVTHVNRERIFYCSCRVFIIFSEYVPESECITLLYNNF